MGQGGVVAVQVLQTARGGCGQRTGLWVGFDGGGGLLEKSGFHGAVGKPLPGTDSGGNGKRN